MTTVRFSNWERGLNKVALTKLIRVAGGVPLNQAHALVNRLLAGDRPELQMSSLQNARRLVQKARALGVGALCVSSRKPSTAAS